MLKRIVAAFLFTIMAVSSYGQDSTAMSVLERQIVRNTMKITLINLNTDTITSYSYLAIFDEASRLDTIVLSSLPGQLDIPDKSIARLKAGFQNLDTLGLELKNAALFVPVLVLPMAGSYRVVFTQRARSEAFASWENVFSVLKPELLKNKHLKFIKPVFVSVSPIIRCGSARPQKLLKPLATPPFKQIR